MDKKIIYIDEYSQNTISRAGFCVGKNALNFVLFFYSLGFLTAQSVKNHL